MAVIQRVAEGSATAGETRRTVLLDASTLGNDFCEISKVVVAAGEPLSERTGPEELVWFQVLSGSGAVDGRPVASTSVAFAGPDCPLEITAESTLDLLWVRVPRAGRFDADVDTLAGVTKVTDWSREPVLQSEHDARTRIYVATPALLGTGAIKAEIISYPPGTSAPEHHHEGADHFQYVISGRGTAVLEGKPHDLVAGDVLYNYPHEKHWFFTDDDAVEDFVFVEFFVPGHCKTVWVDASKACAWLPTGRNVRGETPVREIAYHLSGEDSGV